MKGISAAIILMTIVAGSAADAAIRCEGAPGREQRGVYWSWREIDGKRCWFIRTSGAMPAKSAFTWVKEEPVEKDVPAAPEKTKTRPTVQMLRVKPDEDLSDVRANWLDDAPVDLTVGEDLRGTFGVGGNWVVPAYAATAPQDDLFRDAVPRTRVGRISNRTFHKSRVWGRLPQMAHDEPIRARGGGVSRRQNTHSRRLQSRQSHAVRAASA